jgi:hypothetical protein
MNDLISQFKAARNVSVPICAVNTPDPGATCLALKEALPDNIPLISWNIVSAFSGLNELGQHVATDNSVAAGDPISALVKAKEKFPAGSILFLFNAHRLLHELTVVQAIWNLRDEFKNKPCMLVLLAPDIKLPIELQQDVLVLDEPLPGTEELKNIVDLTAKNKTAKLAVPVDYDKAVTALRGLPAFAADQVMALSIQNREVVYDLLWERKRQMIQDTPGLSIYRGTEKFNDIGGLDHIKSYMRKVIAGKESPSVVCFIDEGEKQFSGATSGTSDSSGVSQGFLGTLLTYQQDHHADGMMLYGPPGAAKSAFAKAVGNEAGILCVQLDLNGLKSSLVGESEINLRNALKIITAVCGEGGRALFLMTCNRHVALPPELRRRYGDMFYFDLPDEDERKAIFKIYVNKYDIDVKQVKDVISEAWTGAEIERCCQKAYRLGMTLKEASQFIVPVSKSAADEIDALRKQADRKFLSAAYPGPYLINRPTTTTNSRIFAETEKEN